MTASTDLVTSDAQAPAIVKQLEHVSPLLDELGVDRRQFVATVITQLNANPQLRKCTPESFIAAAYKSARLNLQPGDELGWCWLIPRKNKHNRGRLEVTWMLGYRGMVELARRAGITITVGSVYQGDTYSERGGDNPGIDHTHGPNHGTGEPVRWYAVAHLPDGQVIPRSLSREQVEQRRRMGEGQGDAPKFAWATSYDAMARKSTVRAIFNTLPAGMSHDLVDAITGDGNVVALPPADSEPEPDVEVLDTTAVVPDQLDEALVLNLEEWRHAADLDNDAKWQAWIAGHCDGADQLADLDDEQARALLDATRSRAQDGDA